MLRSKLRNIMGKKGYNVQVIEDIKRLYEGAVITIDKGAYKSVIRGRHTATVCYLISRQPFVIGLCRPIIIRTGE
jgi:hypothetical protein